MDFQTTLSPANEQEFIKSWTSVYQSGLLQFRGEKREPGEIGFLRPVASYLFAFVAGFCILMWGMQGIEFSLTGVEVACGALVLFVLAISLSYFFRKIHFTVLARKKIYHKGMTQVHADDKGIAFTPEGKTQVFWGWKEITKVVFFGKTLVIYSGSYKNFAQTQEQVLIINKESLPREQCDALIREYLRPLKLENKLEKYNSYSDIVIYILLCIIIGIASFSMSLFV